MTRVLIVTVGGSPEPILKAVELHQPDEVIFACSAPPCQAPSLEQVIGAGTPCRHRVDGCDELRPNLVVQLDLKGFRPDLQIINLPDPDNLNDCLVRLRTFIQSLKSRFTQLKLYGDFTGGTKSMSTALAISLLDEGAVLTVIDGTRKNLVRIEHSTGLRVVDATPLVLQRILQDQLPALLSSHFYERSLSLLQQFQRDHGTSLDLDQQTALNELLDQLRILTLWDRFRWDDALAAASVGKFASHWPELHAWWQRVVAAKDWDPETPASAAITGYELVQDLLLNAERRGRRGWYDDAVARLYRATELLAQTYITLELASDECFANTGVRGLFRWLQQREPSSGLGGIYSRQWRELNSLFNARNQSLLGHGLRPIDQATWQSLQDRVCNLLNTTLAELGCRSTSRPCQLPGEQLLSHSLVALLQRVSLPSQP